MSTEKRKYKKSSRPSHKDLGVCIFSLDVSEEQRVRFAYTKCLANKFLFPDSESTSAGRLSDISNGKKLTRGNSRISFGYAKNLETMALELRE